VKVFVTQKNISTELQCIVRKQLLINILISFSKPVTTHYNKLQLLQKNVKSNLTKAALLLHITFAVIQIN